MPPGQTLPLPIFRSNAQATPLTHLYVTGGDRPLSLSGLSQETEIPLSTVQREIEQLERAGLVASERVGQTRFVHANRDSRYYAELQSLLLKAFGPTALLARLFGRIPRIITAFVYGSWARRYHGEEGGAPRDLDVLVVGDPDPNQVYAAARRAEGELGLEVNPVIVSLDEWEKPRGFIQRIKKGLLVEVPLS